MKVLWTRSYEGSRNAETFTYANGHGLPNKRLLLPATHTCTSFSNLLTLMFKAKFLEKFVALCDLEAYVTTALVWFSHIIAGKILKIFQTKLRKTITNFFILRLNLWIAVNEDKTKAVRHRRPIDSGNWLGEEITNQGKQNGWLSDFCRLAKTNANANENRNQSYCGCCSNDLFA